jgi:hypothetical protein
MLGAKTQVITQYGDDAYMIKAHGGLAAVRRCCIAM